MKIKKPQFSSFLGIDELGSHVAQWVKNLPAMQEMQEMWVRYLGGEHPTPVFLPEESHRQRSLAGYSTRGRKELDTTEVTEHALMHKC